MSEPLQYFVVVTLVLVAALYLLRAAIKTLSAKRQSGCSSCSGGGCDGDQESNSEPVVKSFVPLESLQRDVDVS